MKTELIEPLLLRIPYGFTSRIRIAIYRCLGMQIGKKNRFESGRIRRCKAVKIGNWNAFTEGWFLWPEDTPHEGKRIVIGDDNYFNRSLMIDACNYIEIGSHNMFGPYVYITDSNHTYGLGIDPHLAPMQKGKVIIGNYCWIGAHAVILKDVVLGDYCVVAAGAVVTKSFPTGSVIAGVPARLVKKLEKKD